jgi:Na+:H+ antiporter, NhaC family
MNTAPTNQRTDIESPEGVGEATFLQALVPIFVLVLLIGYGLVYRPLAWRLLTPYVQPQDPIPLELIFILAASITIVYLFFLGHKWTAIQSTIVSRLAQAMPAFFILFSIGLIIASWIVCGTIPMLVCWGLKIIDPNYFYVVAFIAPMVFSSLTGTSWGSAGTIGVVLIGMATALDANLGLTAGAIIGGAFFGDKLSPLSDTTNLAALAAGVDVFDHIKSMLWTTVPATVLAGAVYIVMGFIDPPTVQSNDLGSVQQVVSSLEELFYFSPFLLIPPLIVLVGSWRRLPTVPVLMTSIVFSCGLAFALQPYALGDIMASVHKGYSTSMATWVENVPENVSTLLDRGGLYALQEAIVTAFTVFLFIGAMDHIKAMQIVVRRLLKPVQSPRGTILSSLLATGFTNAMTSNQYATSFIIGDAFKSKYDQTGTPRKVLSRSIEDTGTMLESLIPWTTTALYMVATLRVPWSAYWHWQLLSIFNIVIAFTLAATGIGCFLSDKGTNAKLKIQTPSDDG